MWLIKQKERCASAVGWDDNIDHEAVAEHQTGILLELLTAHPFLSVVCCPQVGRN